MSKSETAWWPQAQAQGLLPADATAPQLPPSPSWVVQGLCFVGAQLVLWPFLSVLALLLEDWLLESVGALLTSAALAAIALCLLRQSRLVFVEQLGMNLLLAAQVLWVVGWASWLNAPPWLVVLSLLLLQLALAFASQVVWIAHLFGVLASWSLFALPALPGLSGSATAEHYDWWQVLGQWPNHTLLLAAVWALWGHYQGRLLTRTGAATASAVMEGAGVGILLALVLKSSVMWVMFSGMAQGSADVQDAGQALLWSITAPKLLQAVAVLLSAWWLLQRWQPQGRALGLGGLVFAAALTACLAVGSMGTLAVMATFAAGTRRWRMLWLALVVLALELANFYYALQWPLVDKAVGLALVGAAMVLALWCLRSPAAQPRGEDSAPSRTPTISRWLVGAVVLVAAVVALGLVHVDVQRKEQVLAQGQKIFVPLAPRDPRSLLQGDYMALNFAYSDEVNAQLQTYLLQEPSARGVLVVAQLDARGVATIERLAQPQETATALHPGQILLPLKHLKGQWVVVTDAFFFPEGQGRPLAAARFGEFRVLPSGQGLLAGLADEHLQPLLPAAVPDDGTEPEQPDEAWDDDLDAFDPAPEDESPEPDSAAQLQEPAAD